MAKNNTARPVRSCDVCGQQDDHPRHVQGQVVRHLDCCAAQGCAVCTETEAATEGRRGQELVDHLEQVRATDG